jgi:hypothetical protein
MSASIVTQMESVMSKLTKATLVALTVLIGASPTFAATTHPMEPHRMHHRLAVHDRWFQPVHLDNAGVPAKTYFEQMQRDE